MPTKELISFSIDALTTGSEYSGDRAALFLSVWRRSNHYNNSNNNYNNHNDTLLLGRYSLSGCGCDLLSRAAADQRFALGSVAALFCSCSTNNIREEGVLALPALLYALQGAGVASVSIVSAGASVVLEQLVDLVHGTRTYPKVRICQIPNTNDDKQKPTWWRVYEDQHIVVHAQSFLREVALSTGADQDVDTVAVVYLFTFRDLLSRKQNSFVFLPEATPGDMVDSLVSRFSRKDLELPLINDTPTKLLCVVCVQKGKDSLPVAAQTMNCVWINIEGSSFHGLDNNLLVRARKQTLRLRERCNAKLRPCFPFIKVMPHSKATERSNIVSLQTGTSLFFHLKLGDDFAGGAIDTVLVDRLAQLALDASTTDLANRTVEANAAADDCIHQLEEFLTDSVDQDDNEIDIDDPEESSNPAVQLLVLGTGCASPSPHRGASGYVLFLPSVGHLQKEETAIVVEAGEGFCTQFNRYGNGRKFASISVIWISHAHWDHYGGLVNLLQRISRERQQEEKVIPSCCPPEKRPRRTSRQVPIVVAPERVFAFLRLMFKYPLEYYEEASMFGPDGPMSTLCMKINKAYHHNLRPLLQWENVRVDHSCYDSYGTILVLRRLNGAPFFFCYSGDTRPSKRFVKCCRNVAKGSQVDFLLHEATFEESEREKCYIKMHSTVNEALGVARDINTKKVLLTHFSQRYKISRLSDSTALGPARMKVAFAVDGLLLPLFEQA